MVVVGETLVAGTVGGVFVSTNNGDSWTRANTGLVNPYTNCLAVYGNTIFAGTYDGVFVSTNGGATWKGENSGLTNKSIRSLTISNQTIAVGVEGAGVFISPLPTSQ
jgi:hypothetical protein